MSRSLGVTLLLSVVILIATSPSAQAILRCPIPEGGVCGQCERELLSEFDSLLASVESGKVSNPDAFIASLPKEMLDNPPALIGKSMSTQKTSIVEVTDPYTGEKRKVPMPRVAYKSPNAELWVTVNTDPKAEGYKKVEVMRWDGKKGEFRFQEVSFEKNKPAVKHDAKDDCIRCHQNPPRPNFDAYQTWAGFLPPRDDVLEVGPDGEPDENSKLWIAFMEEVIAARAQAKKTGTPNRLSSIPIPYPGDLSDREKLDLIIREIKEGKEVKTPNEASRPLKGYRVPHIPNKGSGKLKSFDGATSDIAGFGHTAFDQLSFMNGCQIRQSIKKHPDFEKFKYASAGAYLCSEEDDDIIEKFYPDSFTKSRDRYFASKGTLRDSIDPESLVALKGSCEGAAEIKTKLAAARAAEQKSSAAKTYSYKDLLRDTEISQATLDIEKQCRQETYLIEAGVEKEIAIRKGKSVQSVPDNETRSIAAFRYLLEPLGVDVGSWSMSFGSDFSERKLNFADQFDLIFESSGPGLPDIFRSIKDECRGRNCEMLGMRLEA